MVGARVNGQQVPIDYILQNGDRVEIVTSQNAKGPSRDWLKIVKSSQAKNKINQWFKKEFKEENIVRGKELLHEYCKTKGLELSKYLQPQYKERVQIKYGFHDWDSALAAIGHGGLKEGQVMNKLMEEYEKEHPKLVSNEEILEELGAPSAQPKKVQGSRKNSIVVKGLHDVSVRFSRCCNPVPGDEIVGFITRGRGISLHRTDCVNLLAMDEMDRQRLIEAEWDKKEQDQNGERFKTEITLYAYTQQNLLMNITKVFTERGIDVISLNARNGKQGKSTYSITFETSGTSELNSLITKLRSLDGIIDIERTTG